jgi:putative transposase
VFKVFAYRLYPSNAQRRRLEQTLETCRRFYNDCLHERKAVSEVEGRTLSKVKQLRRVKIHKINNPFAADIHSHVLQVVVTDLDKAFQAFFRRLKAGEKPGFPRFKPFTRFRSFGFKEVGNGFKVDGRRLRLSGIGRVAVHWHRPLEGTVKTLRISCKAGKWYASFCCEVEATPLPPCSDEVGIDAGLKCLLALCTGEKIPNPRWYRRSQGKQRILQRAVTRKKKGGSNRRKAIRQLSRHAEHVANQRKDYLGKLVSALIATFGYIAVEDLSIQRLVQGNLAKSILDAGWGFFRQRLLAKAANAGRVVTLVDPAYTSQDCSGCGHRQKLSLAERWYECPCGHSLDRDHNAALNVLTRGQRVWALSSETSGLAQEAAALRASGVSPAPTPPATVRDWPCP